MTDHATVEQIDGITLILHDHRNVEEFFTRYEQASEADEKLRLVAKMIEALSMHAAIEERVLYPLIDERLGGDEELKQHAVEEHEDARAVLIELEQLPVTDERFDEKVHALIADVRHHVEEEESELLPQLRDALSEDELLQLGRDLREAKVTAPVSPSQEFGSGPGAASKTELYERAKAQDLEGRAGMSRDELASELQRELED
jgi:hemerythrin superfamily protein